MAAEEEKNPQVHEKIVKQGYLAILSGHLKEVRSFKSAFPACLSRLKDL